MVDEAYLVILTFVPATSVMNPDGSTDEPLITIYNEEGGYAFPIMTHKIASIYKNILAPYQNYEIVYAAEKVTIYVLVSNRNEIDPLVDQVNYDVAEGDGWGDLILDDETLTYYHPNLEGYGGILYVPLLQDVEILKRGKDGKWRPF